MTRKEYRMLRVIYRTGSLQRLGEFLRERESLDPRPRSASDVVQLRFVCAEVYCDALKTELTVAECVRRAKAMTPAGRGKGFPLYGEACGRCPLREVHQAMAPAFVPAPYRVNPNRLRKQRAAMGQAAKRGEFERVPTIDSPAGEE